MSDFLSPQSGFVFLFFCILLTAAGEDASAGRIRNRYSIGIMTLALLSCVLGLPPGLAERFMGLCIAGLPLYTAAVVREGSFGGGDVKLSASCGFFLGAEQGAAFLMWTLAAAGIWAGALFLKGRKGRGERLALGPFFALGAAIALWQTAL